MTRRAFSCILVTVLAATGCDCSDSSVEVPEDGDAEESDVPADDATGEVQDAPPDQADGQEDQGLLNDCGGITPLPDTPGDPCGNCGTFACSGPEAVECRGDHELNACGGCTTLANLPGDPCETSGTYVCNGTDDVACLVPAFYVATDGDDGNDGLSASTPFATLARAQEAMRASSSIKTAYVLAGTYSPPASASSHCRWGAVSSAITLTDADSGETWSYYPPDGHGSAIIDGGSTVGQSGLGEESYGGPANGIWCAFSAANAENVTITGLQFQRFAISAFWGDHSHHLTFTHNIVHDLTSMVFNSGGIFLHNSPDASVRGNYMYDLATFGAVADVSDNGDISNTTIADNIIVNSCSWPAMYYTSPDWNDQDGGDCGAVYVGLYDTGTAANIQVFNNYIRDVNTSSNIESGGGDWGGGGGTGIYLDDGISDITVSGNVITGLAGWCFMIHGGNDNIIQGNVCDLNVSWPQVIVAYQPCSKGLAMSGNVFAHNVVVSGSTGAGSGFRGCCGGDLPPNPMTIHDNAYYNFIGSPVNSSGTDNAGDDSNPVYEDPQISCWDAEIDGGSPVFDSPVSFPGITGGWGPPGFVVPQTGTPPSWPVTGCSD
jgi:hypothetical protein